MVSASLSLSVVKMARTLSPQDSGQLRGNALQVP